MTELKTAPWFRYDFGELGEDGWELPVTVEYYSNCITLEQEGREVNIPYEHFNKLFAAIKKHKEEALNIKR